MRADNKGEGGILSLVVLVETALEAQRRLRARPRHRRRRLLLRRCDDHARRFRCCPPSKAWRVINPGFEPYVVPISLAVLLTLFAVPVSRHRQRCLVLRARSRPCGSRSSASSALIHIGDDPEDLLRLQSDLSAYACSSSNPDMALADPRRRVPGRHRRRGALCRYRPFRQEARSASPGCRSCCPALILNYLGQGAFVHANPAAGHQSLLPDGAVLGADPAGRPRHHGHGDRQPGRHHRRLLDRPAGDRPRPLAAHEHHPHERERIRARSISAR